MNELEILWMVGYEKRYDISENGTIKSYCGNNNCGFYIRRSPKILKPSLDRGGYYHLRIGDKYHKDIKRIRVHVEVAKAFIQNPENKPEVNHIDGNKQNNHKSNLEWATRLENIAHAFKTGLIIPAVGEAQSATKLKNEEVIAIYKSHEKIKDLAIRYRVHSATISSIRTGQYWGHLTGGRREDILKQRRLMEVEILAIFNSTEERDIIAQKYEISKYTVYAIKSGKEHSKITGKNFIKK